MGKVIELFLQRELATDPSLEKLAVAAANRDSSFASQLDEMLRQNQDLKYAEVIGMGVYCLFVAAPEGSEVEFSLYGDTSGLIEEVRSLVEVVSKLTVRDGQLVSSFSKEQLELVDHFFISNKKVFQLPKYTNMRKFGEEIFSFNPDLERAGSNLKFEFGNSGDLVLTFRKEGASKKNIIQVDVSSELSIDPGTLNLIIDKGFSEKLIRRLFSVKDKKSKNGPDFNDYNRTLLKDLFLSYPEPVMIKELRTKYNITDHYLRSMIGHMRVVLGVIWNTENVYENQKKVAIETDKGGFKIVLVDSDDSR